MWEKQIQSGMDNYKPAVLLIKPSRNLGFPYQANGHYVNTSGLEINTGGITPYATTRGIYNTQIRITDSWGPGLGNRWYDARNVFQAIRNHEFKVMLY